MIEIAHFNIFEEKPGSDSSFSLYLPPSQFGELEKTLPSDFIKTWPHGDRGIAINRDIADPYVQHVLAYLKKNGYQAVASGRRKRNYEFTIRIDRQFSEEELLSASYLNVMLQTRFAKRLDVSMDCKKVMVSRSEIKQTRKLGYIDSNQWVFISNEIKDAIKREGLRVSFQEVYDLNPPHEFIDGVNQLVGEICLPPLQGLTYTDSYGQPHDGDPQIAKFPVEGLYSLPQLQFEKAGFTKLEPFDFACTQEGFYGPARMAVYFNVCSNRMFRFLRKYDKKLIAIPIRLI